MRCHSLLHCPRHAVNHLARYPGVERDAESPYRIESPEPRPWVEVGFYCRDAIVQEQFERYAREVYAAYYV